MNTDEDFNIKFVHIIKKHRCLYDKKVPEYRNKDYQEKSWIEISRDTRESVSHCKERWRNLRACLSRYIKQQSSADPQHKPYYLTEHMQFLLPFLRPSRQSSLNSSNHHGNNNNSDTNTFSNCGELRLSSLKDQFSPHDESTADGFEDVIHQQHQQQLNIKHDSLDDQNNHHPVQQAFSETDTASVNFVPPPEVQLQTEDTNPAMVSFLSPMHRLNGNAIADDPNIHKRIKFEDDNNYPNSHRISSCTYNGESSDMDFFRSILPDIDGMNAQQKRKFKIGVLELIDDVFYKYPDKSNNCRNNKPVNGFWRK